MSDGSDQTVSWNMTAALPCSACLAHRCGRLRQRVSRRRIAQSDRGWNMTRFTTRGAKRDTRHLARDRDAAATDRVRTCAHGPAGRISGVSGFTRQTLHRPAFLRARTRTLWRKSWLFAGHLDEIPEPGCYKLFDVGATERGARSCRRRRSARVLQHVPSSRRRPGARAIRPRQPAGVRLPRLDLRPRGSLIALRDERDFVGLDKSCRSLYPVRIERLGKFLFVNFDADARPLEDEFAAVSAAVASVPVRIVALRAKDRFELNCNWKIAMEANMEVYHVPSIHPTTVSPLLDHRGQRKYVVRGRPRSHGRAVATRSAGRTRARRIVPRSRPLAKLRARARCRSTSCRISFRR